MRLLWSFVLLTLASVLVWSEVLHARVSRRRLGADAGSAGSREVVVVFGVRNRGRRANLLNRYRVRVGLRSRDPEARSSRLIFSGGVTSKGVPAEAVVMAEYAATLGVDPNSVELEVRSRTTWENVLCVVPELEGAERIVFASNGLHAEKARAYLWRQRPDLARRLVQARDHRFGELLPLKPVLAWVGVRNLRRMSASI